MVRKIFTSVFLFFFSFSGVFAMTESENWLKAAKFLASQDIIKSYTNDAEYRIQDTITRKEVMKIVAKLAGVTPEEKCVGKYKDVENDWGCKYIERALSVWFIAPGEKFRPNDNITKSEAVKLIFKARNIQKIYNTSNWQEDYAKTAADLGLVTLYTDYSSDAKRGWIFALAANNFKEYVEQKSDIISDEAM